MWSVAFRTCHSIPLLGTETASPNEEELSVLSKKNTTVRLGSRDANSYMLQQTPTAIHLNADGWMAENSDGIGFKNVCFRKQFAIGRTMTIFRRRQWQRCGSRAKTQRPRNNSPRTKSHGGLHDNNILCALWVCRAAFWTPVCPSFAVFLWIS